MRVKILLTVPDERFYGSSTMVLDTIRVGYPSAFVTVYLNPVGPSYLLAKALERIRGCQPVWLGRPVHHAEWIKQMVEAHAADLGDQEPLIIVDGDVCFHKSCEDWAFDNFLAGYFIPTMWNDFAQCRSFARLHTSHLWFTKPRMMLERIRSLVPTAFGKNSDYCPLDIFHPRTMVVDKEPFFWDSMSVAYQLLGGSPFNSNHLDCYDHLNSASFFDVMHDRLENKKAFEFMHTEGYKNLDFVRSVMWKAQNSYYDQKAQQFKP